MQPNSARAFLVCVCGNHGHSEGKMLQGQRMRGGGGGARVKYDLRAHIPALMLLGTTQRQRYTHGGDEAGWPQILTAWWIA